MRRYILTGTPGCGKTAILRQLEIDGFSTVEEAATDVIALRQACGAAEPWTDPSFIDAVLDLQKRRQMRSAHEPGETQFHDRSAVCTAALAMYLGYSKSAALMRELVHIQDAAIFEKQVFFIGNLGFVAHTEARRISFEESLRFERMHEEAYLSLGFELVYVEPGSVADRVSAITSALRAFNAAT